MKSEKKGIETLLVIVPDYNNNCSWTLIFCYMLQYIIKFFFLLLFLFLCCFFYFSEKKYLILLQGSTDLKGNYVCLEKGQLQARLDSRIRVFFFFCSSYLQPPLSPFAFFFFFLAGKKLHRSKTLS